MHNHYKDILDRIPEPPGWFDENGTPRYGEFVPRQVSNIYATEVALAEIACQACGRRFKVALTDGFASSSQSLGDAIRLRNIGYGDPPNIECCPAGPTMTSEMLRIEQYWFRDYEIGPDWVRDERFEGIVEGPSLEPPNTVEAVRQSQAGGSRSVRVVCMSARSRCDLAGRLTSDLAGSGRVVVIFPMDYVVVANHMLDGYVPQWERGRPGHGTAKVVLAPIDRLAAVVPDDFDSVVILTGPIAHHAARLAERNAVDLWLLTMPADKLKLEFALPHSDRILASPAAEIDAGEGVGWPEPAVPGSLH